MATIDKSLDEIIAAKPKHIRRKRPSAARPARAAILGTANAGPTVAIVNAANRHLATANAAVNAGPSLLSMQQAATKIIVSNLPHDVNEAQVKELFSHTVGPLREMNLNYDARGQSKGVAYVTFAKQGHGYKAFTEYNGRLIDGKRPMKVEIVLDPIKTVPTLASRVAPAATTVQPVVVVANGVNGHTGGVQKRGRGALRGRGLGRGRGGRGGKTNNRPAKTQADLDQEMEDYSTTNTVATAAPVAAA